MVILQIKKRNKNVLAIWVSPYLRHYWGYFKNFYSYDKSCKFLRLWFICISWDINPSSYVFQLAKKNKSMFIK